MVSSQMSSRILCSFTPVVPMPALATTMSSRPSCSTPLSSGGLQRVEVADVDVSP